MQGTLNEGKKLSLEIGVEQVGCLFSLWTGKVDRYTSAMGDLIPRNSTKQVIDPLNQRYISNYV